MKIVAFVSLLFLAPGCGPSGTTGPDPPESDSVEIYFPDPALETAIRMRIGKAKGPVYTSDLATLGQVELNSQGITNLSGLEHLTSVHTLSLANNFVTDLAPISGLTTLTELHLSNNLVTDLTPISGLTSLTKLYLTRNIISSIEPLAQLTGLDTLRLSMNPIQDFSPLGALTRLRVLAIMETPGLGEMTWLSALTELQELHLGWAPITSIQGVASIPNLRVLWLSNVELYDISPLANLARLRTLYIDRNEISDLAPLVANKGIGAGDHIRVFANPLNRWEACPQIRILRERGARVDEDLGCR